MEAVKGALRDGDLILVVTQLELEKPSPDDNDYTNTTTTDSLVNIEDSSQDPTLQSIQKTDKPVIVVINKCDLAYPSSMKDSDDMKNVNEGSSLDADADSLIDATIQKWRTLIPKAKLILPCSAIQKEDDPGFHLLRSLLLLDADLPTLFRQLGRPRPGMFPPNQNDNTHGQNKPKMWLENDEAREWIPSGPPLYEVDSLTDRTERFFASEIIRGSIFLNLGKEVPYCCEVRIQQFQEPKGGKDNATRIRADIIVERDSQKGIVVGKGGSMIKVIGMDARRKLKEFLGQDKIFLELTVRVDKNWRRNEDRLKEYGYLKPKKK